MISHFENTQTDPITNRDIGNQCWNMTYEDHEEHDTGRCQLSGCQCMCHDHRKDADGTYDWTFDARGESSFTW